MNARSRMGDGPGGRAGAILFHQAQAGCRDSVEQLMSVHDGLVHPVVRRQVLGDLPYAEALQAGRLGLWRAILGFDPQRGTAFCTYAWICIVHHVWREVKVDTRFRAQATEHLPLNEVSSAAPETADPALAWEVSLVRSAIWDLVARLPSRLRTVVLARYGLTGQPPAIYAHIGAMLGLSAERARQLHWEALISLRQPAHSQQLRSLLEHHTLADYETVQAETELWLRWRGGRCG